MPYGPVSAKVNNKVEGLHYRFIMIKMWSSLMSLHLQGCVLIPARFFRVGKSCERFISRCVLRIETPVSRGYYCDLRMGRPIEEDDVTAIWRRMREIVDADIPFTVYKVLRRMR